MPALLIRMSVSRGLIAAIALLACLAGISRTEHRTRVEIETGPGLTVSVRHATLSVPAESDPPRRLRVFVPDGVEPVTLQNLETGKRGALRTIPFQQTLHRRPGTPQISDWFVDSKTCTSRLVLDRALEDVPEVIHATFRGRSNGFIRIDLAGRTTVSIFVRSGLLYDDVFLRKDAATIESSRLYVDIQGTSMGIANTFLKAMVGAIGFLLLGCLLGLVPEWKDHTPPAAAMAPLSSPTKKCLSLSYLTAALLSLSFTFAAAWVARDVLEAVPHFQDDMGYLLRARWLVAGHLTQPIDELSPSLEIPFTVSHAGRWFVGYTIGWPALLAPALALGVPWLVSPVAGGFLVFVIFLLGRNLFDAKTGLLAAAMAALSPLFGLLSATAFSHAAVGLLTTVFPVLALNAWEREKKRQVFVAGLVLGAAFCCRPLTAIAVAIPHGLFFLFETAGRRGQRFPLFFPLIAGGVLGTVPVFIDNALTTGSPLRFGLELLGLSWRFSHFPIGLYWADISLAQLPPLLLGWLWEFPLASYLFGIVLTIFLSGRATRRDVLLLGVFVSLCLAHLGHLYPGNHGYGPRFYFEALPALFVLASRGFFAMIPPTGGVERRGFLPVLLAGALLATSLVSWKERMTLYRGYNFVTDRLEAAVGESRITNGVIVLDPPSYLNWVRAGNLIPASWDDPLVVVGRNEDSTLYERYPGRPFYLWRRGQLIPAGTPSRHGEVLAPWAPEPSEEIEVQDPLHTWR